MSGAKAKGLFVKNIKKFMALFLKKLIMSNQKYEKWKPNEKFSIKCKHIGEGSYMFISTSEIGHLTLY